MFFFFHQLNFYGDYFILIVAATSEMKHVSSAKKKKHSRLCRSGLFRDIRDVLGLYLAHVNRCQYSLVYIGKSMPHHGVTEKSIIFGNALVSLPTHTHTRYQWPNGFLLRVSAFPCFVFHQVVFQETKRAEEKRGGPGQK